MSTLTIQNLSTGKIYTWKDSENQIPLKGNPIPTTIIENSNFFFIKPEKNILLNGHRFSETKELKHDDRIQYFDCHGVLESFSVVIKTTLKQTNILHTAPTLPRLAFNLNQFAKYCYSESKACGFHKDEEQGEKDSKDLSKYLMNLHGEISELWEAYRNNKLNELCDKSEKMKDNEIVPLTCFEEELADIIIRCGDLAAAFGIDLEKSVSNKIKFNRTRDYRNGGKLC